MRTRHISIIIIFIISIVILTFLSNNVYAESSQSIIRAGSALPPDMKNMLYYLSCGSTPVVSYDKISRFVLDNNPNLQNQSIIDKSQILDMIVPTIEKKLITESPGFKSIHGVNDSIVFDYRHVGPHTADCFSFESIGTFQTDSKERYRLQFGVGPDFTYGFTLYPDLGLQSSKKYLVITQVELASTNGTQWVRIYNPNKVDIPLDTLYLAGSNGELKYFGPDSIDTLNAGDNVTVQLDYQKQRWSDVSNSISFQSSYPDIYGNDLDTNYNTSSPTIWDKTPPLTDTYNDSRTWQFDGNKWLFTDKQIAIPEFPFAIPVLLLSIISLIVFYRMKFRK